MAVTTTVGWLVKSLRSVSLLIIGPLLKYSLSPDHQKNDVSEVCIMDDIMTKRADVFERYAALREQHPALPEVLREFQVCSMMSVLVAVQ